MRRYHSESWSPLSELASEPLSSRRGRRLPHADWCGPAFHVLTDALVLMAENQNITLSLPRDLLKHINRLAVDRDTSVSVLMKVALARIADADIRYSSARRRALTAMRSARSLDTRGRQTWTRDELHER